MKYISDLPEGTTKEDLAKSIPELWDQETGRHLFDYALPQTWTNEVNDRFIDVEYGAIISSFVWFYPKNSGAFGQPYPLTLDGIDILSKLAAAIRITNS